tara:strand:- start:142 stop:360 length:219 start_codon:yes stop_codon:yes gene_type:complete
MVYEFSVLELKTIKQIAEDTVKEVDIIMTCMAKSDHRGVMQGHANMKRDFDFLSTIGTDLKAKYPDRVHEEY